MFYYTKELVIRYERHSEHVYKPKTSPSVDLDF
jgi:hypothetical protein